MKSCSDIGFALAAILSYPSIRLNNNSTLETSVRYFFKLLEQYSPDTYTLICNEKMKGKFIEETIEYVTTEWFRDTDNILVIKENTTKDKYKVWVQEPISYYLIIPKVTKVIENNLELNREMQKIASCANNAFPENNLSYNLCSLAEYYYLFAPSISDNSLNIAEDLYIKSLMLIDDIGKYIIEYNRFGRTLLFLGNIYFKQQKNKQAKDFYIECALYNQKPYADTAVEKVILLGGYNHSKPFFQQKRIRVIIVLLILIFSPFINKIFGFLPIMPIVILLIILGAVFNENIVKWSIKYQKEKFIRTTLKKVYKLIKKYNL